MIIKKIKIKITKIKITKMNITKMKKHSVTINQYR